MRQVASAVVIAVTAYFLIATSQAPCRSSAETVSLTSRTTCGPDTLVTLSVDTSCRVTVTPAGSGLPGNGMVSRDMTPLRQQNVYLSQVDSDAGTSVSCTLDANDAGTGWDVTCTTCSNADGGCVCSGTVTP